MHTHISTYTFKYIGHSHSYQWNNTYTFKLMIPTPPSCAIMQEWRTLSTHTHTCIQVHIHLKYIYIGHSYSYQWNNTYPILKMHNYIVHLIQYLPGLSNMYELSNNMSCCKYGKATGIILNWSNNLNLNAQTEWETLS